MSFTEQLFPKSLNLPFPEYSRKQRVYNTASAHTFSGAASNQLVFTKYKKYISS